MCFWSGFVCVSPGVGVGVGVGVGGCVLSAASGLAELCSWSSDLVAAAWRGG